MQNNIACPHSSHTRPLPFHLDINNVRTSPPSQFVDSKRLSRASNASAIMGLGGNIAFTGQPAPLTRNAGESPNPRTAHHLGTVNTLMDNGTPCHELISVINRPGTQVLQKKANLAVITDTHHEQKIQGLWNVYNFSLLKALLGTSTQPGFIDNIRPQGQLIKLLELMNNFDSLETSQKLYVYQRITDIVTTWHDKNASEKQMRGLRGTALVYFTLHCLRFFPMHHFSRVYEYILQASSTLATEHRDIIVNLLVQAFPRFTKNIASDKRYIYFRHLISVSLLCSKGVRNAVMKNLSKTLLFLPDNHIKKAAILMGLYLKEFLPKNLHRSIEINISECLREKVTHYQRNSINLNSYYQLMTIEKK